MSALFKPRSSHISVRHIKNDIELEAAQHLRYQVFFEEFGATPSNDYNRDNRRDIDKYDDVADHLIVISTDKKTGDDTIIGTYRLLKQTQAEAHGEFNSGKWYNLTPLLESGQSLLELSRSCVLPEYRTRNILTMLWQGIGDYISQHNIDIMFGCASFHTANPETIKEELSYLYHYHLAPDAVRCKALDHLYVEMDMMKKKDINTRKAFHALPPLIKGYLRVGSSVGHGAVVDHEFETTDVFVSMQTHMLSEKYRKHYDVNTPPKETPSSAYKAADILAENSENITK
jgi:putative hemolysin